MRSWASSYRLRLVLEDLSGLLLVAQLLDALPLQVALLVLFKQRVGSLVPAQELGGCGLAQDFRETHGHTLIQMYHVKLDLLCQCLLQQSDCEQAHVTSYICD